MQPTVHASTWSQSTHVVPHTTPAVHVCVCSKDLIRPLRRSQATMAAGRSGAGACSRTLALMAPIPDTILRGTAID